MPNHYRIISTFRRTAPQAFSGPIDEEMVPRHMVVKQAEFPDALHLVMEEETFQMWLQRATKAQQA